MKYNLFEAQLRATESEIQSLERSRVAVEEGIAWARGFDPRSAGMATQRVRSQIEKRTAEHANRQRSVSELEAEIAQAEGKSESLKRDTRVDWRIVTRMINGDQAAARRQLETHRREVHVLRKRVAAAQEELDVGSAKIADLTNELAATERAIEQFEGFVATEAERDLADIDSRLMPLGRERDYLAKRSHDVELAVEAVVKELKQYEAEVEERESRNRRHQSELSRLRRQADEVEEIRTMLSAEPDANERRKLHQRCGREFGYEKPRDASRAIRDTMTPLTEEIHRNEAKLRQLSRHIAKTEERIMKMASAASREIDALVIDGNNCCFSDDDVFVGLAALVPMTERLAERYPVEIVFDASIRPRLQLTDGEIRSRLPAATVYFAGAGTDADEMILCAADKPNSWVISNDRFGDFGEKSAVRERRVIRRVIFPGRVLVSDLQVDEPFLEPSGGSSDHRG